MQTERQNSFDKWRFTATGRAVYKIKMRRISTENALHQMGKMKEKENKRLIKVRTNFSTIRRFHSKNKFMNQRGWIRKNEKCFGKKILGFSKK